MKKSTKFPMESLIREIAAEFARDLKKKADVMERRSKRIAVKWMNGCLIEESRSKAAVNRWKKLWRKELAEIVADAKPPVRLIRGTPSQVSALAYAYGMYAAHQANASIELQKNAAEEKAVPA